MKRELIPLTHTHTLRSPVHKRIRRRAIVCECVGLRRKTKNCKMTKSDVCGYYERLISPFCARFTWKDHKMNGDNKRDHRLISPEGESGVGKRTIFFSSKNEKRQKVTGVVTTLCVEIYLHLYLDYYFMHNDSEQHIKFEDAQCFCLGHFRFHFITAQAQTYSDTVVLFIALHTKYLLFSIENNGLGVFGTIHKWQTVDEQMMIITIIGVRSMPIDYTVYMPTL